MSVTACAPGLDLAIDFPDDWSIHPFQPNLDPFAFPEGVNTLGSYRLLSCALTIQYWEWFRIEGSDGVSSETILESAFFDPEEMAAKKARLQNRTPRSVPGCDRAELAAYETTVHSHPMKLLQLHAIRSEICGGKRYWSIINVSCAVLVKEYRRYEEALSRILGSVSCATESAIGVCFEIERLEKQAGNYARFALEVFLKRIDPKKLESSRVYWGDVLPDARLFCLKIDGIYPHACRHIRETFGAHEYASPAERFLTGAALVGQPLPRIGEFTESGYVTL